MNPDASYWDRTARDFSVNAGQRLWRRHSDAVNSQLLARWLPQSGLGRALKTDLFDEAFGQGLMRLLRQRASLVVGIDVSPQVLGTAAAQCDGATRMAADVRCLPFSDESFDAVVSLSTLDHFASQTEIESSLRQLRRVLRPGGQLILTMDNLSNPVVWLRNGMLYGWLHRVGIVPYFVGKTCGHKELCRLVADAGMDVKKVEAIMHCPRVLAVAFAKRLESANEATQRRFLRALQNFERLSRWPSRFLSGYFVAVHAIRP